MKDNYKYIETLITRAISNDEISGASICAAQHGRIIYRECFGYRDKENKLPMENDTIFRMFSMTKPVTAAAAMILTERGLIRYTDPVKYYIPAFESMIVEDEKGTRPANRDITIRDLLSMTSGLVYPEDNPAGCKMGGIFDEIKRGNASGAQLTTMEIAEKIGRSPLMFSPGERWHYGTSADIMGAVIEAVSGMKYSDFLRKEIFEPLDMQDTGFYIPKEKYHRLAQIYDRKENGLVPYEDFYLGLTDYKAPPAFESGGAGLVSTIDDYLKFGQMLLEGGRNILSRSSASLMTENMLNDVQKSFAHEWDSVKGYGYGCFMRILEDRTAGGYLAGQGEFGWDGWTGNYFSADPKNDLVFLYFIQNCGAGTTDLMHRVKNIIYSEIL